MFSQPQESEEVEPEVPEEDEMTKIPMSDTAEDYYYDQYDGTCFAPSLCICCLTNFEFHFGIQWSKRILKGKSYGFQFIEFHC